MSLINSEVEYIDKYTQDAAGSPLWLNLFIIADRHSRELAHKLEYLRGCGTVLTPSRKFGYVLQPVIGPDGWASQAEYDKEKQCLNEHLNELLQILRRLADENRLHSASAPNA